MKRLLKKRVLIPLVVVAVLAIGATVAYAWLTADVSVADNNVSTLTVGNFELSGGPINATDLIPANDPDPGETIATPPVDSNVVYPSSTYFALHNATGYSMLYYAYLSAGTGDLDPATVGVRIFLNPPTSAPGYPGGWGAGTFNGGPPGFVVFQGHLSDLWGGIPSGMYWLCSSSGPNFTGVLTPINNDEWAIYRVCIWLDGNVAGNDAMGKSLSCTLNFHGDQYHP
jgi:hypothetical protein